MITAVAIPCCVPQFITGPIEPDYVYRDEGIVSPRERGEGMTSSEVTEIKKVRAAIRVAMRTLTQTDGHLPYPYVDTFAQRCGDGRWFCQTRARGERGEPYELTPFLVGTVKKSELLAYRALLRRVSLELRRKIARVVKALKLVLEATHVP
jgi:hypothetical protein